MTSLYTILQVQSNASSDQIKLAYRKLAQQYHPDINSNNNATQKFQEIQQAYSILGNVKKRAKYDGLIDLLPSNEGGIRTDSYYKKYGTVKKYKAQDPNFIPKERIQVRFVTLEKIAFVAFAMLTTYTMAYSIYKLSIAESIGEYNFALNGVLGAFILNLAFFGTTFYFKKLK